MQIYRDLNADSPLKTPMIEGHACIEESLMSIIETDFLERPFRLDINEDQANTQVLFNLITPVNAKTLLGVLGDLVRKNEPRIRIDHTRSTVIPNLDQNCYDVSIVYSLRGTTGSNALNFQIGG